MTKSVYALSLIIAALVLQGCTKTETVVETTPVGDPFEIRADQYSLRYYFVDTSYMSLYESFYQTEPPIINPRAQILESEVWVQRQGEGFNPTDRFCVAWMSLPARAVSGYDSTYRIAPEVPGTVETARFSRLAPSDYRLQGDGYLGVVSFYDPVPDITFAVAYRRADGAQYGDFVRDTANDSTTLVLKLIKPRNLFSAGPRYREAWQMLLKNVYCLYPAHVSRHGLQLDFFRSNQSNQYESAIHGQPLLRVLGLDRYAIDDTPRPDGDGQFDFRPQRTVNQDFGEIILPSLRPFDTGIKQYFVGRGLPLPGSEYFSPELYDSTQVVARQSGNNRYSIKGRAIFD